MSSSNPPNPNTPPVFNNDAFGQGADPTIDIAYLNANYLRFPTAQGSETLQNIQVVGSATFNNAALPTSAGVLPAPNTISTQIPTMDWVQQAITAGGANILANNNTWTGSNIFTISSLATYSIPALANDTTIANTQWVQSLIAYYYNIILGAGVASPLQTSLLYGREPYTFDLNTAAFNAVFGFAVLQQSFACSVINNTFAYSSQTTFFYSNQPQKPATLAGTLGIVYSTPATSIFNSVQLSGDGNYALICNDGLGTDGSNPYTWKLGTGFTTNNLPYGYWWDSALSLTGQYQIICSNNLSLGLYVSNDYGVSWNETNPLTAVWTSVAVSASGKYMFACNDLGLYYSNDFGATWVGFSAPSDWCNIICSATGQYVLVVPNFQAGTPNDCFLSIDYGVSYTNLNYVGGVPPLMTINNCCMTDDGLMMAIFDSGGTAYQSFNYGLTWTSVPNIVNLKMMTATGVGCKATFAQRNKYLLGIKNGTDPYYAQFSSNW